MKNTTLIILLLVFGAALYAQETELAPQTALPANVDSLIQEAIFYEESDDFELAEETYRDAAKLCPTCGEIYANLAIMFSNVDKIDSALVNISKAVNYSPKNKEMYMLRGGYYTELKDYEKAVADFKKIMELDTMETGFNYDIALCYEAAGKEKEAIQHYERFLANPPEYETAEVLDNARGRLKALKEKN